MKKNVLKKEIFLSNYKSIFNLLIKNTPVKEQIETLDIQLSYKEYLNFINLYFANEYIQMRARILYLKNKTKVDRYLSNYKNDLYSVYLRLVEDEELLIKNKDMSFDRFRKAHDECKR